MTSGVPPDAKHESQLKHSPAGTKSNKNSALLGFLANVFLALGISFLTLAAYKGVLGSDVQSIASKLPSLSWEIPATKWWPTFLLKLDPSDIVLCGFGIKILMSLLRRWKRSVPVYLLDFAVAENAPDLFRTKAEFLEFAASFPNSTPETLEFQRRILETNGLGERTPIPRPILLHHDSTMEAGRAEFREIILPIVDEALRRARLRPVDIDIVVVNCSLFNPTPSMASIIINHFRMRADVQSYNLSGMGCSAGLISLHLAKDLLQVYSHSRALVVSTEILSRAWYHGNDKSMLISNTLFRPGGAAIVLSNHPADRRRAKMQLLHTVRVCNAADDPSYNAIYQTEDAVGLLGVRLARAEALLRVAGDAIRRNLLILGPKVLPYSEQLRFFWSVIRRRYRKDAPLYVPDWKTAFEHFCIHAGGRAVVDGIAKNLQLGDREIAPSRETLKRHGNTSSSSVWYEMRWIEEHGGLRRGDRVFQIAFGSGFKCNTAVWRALRSAERKPVSPDSESAASASVAAAAPADGAH